MTEDYRLLQTALETFLRVRHWTEPDYYREQIMPTVRLLRDRLAIIETEYFITSRRLQHEHYASSKQGLITSPPLPEASPPPVPGPDITIDTIPQRWAEMTTTLAGFDQMVAEHCKDHPDAPHRYLRDMSAAMGRYVCACEFWAPGMPLDK